MLVNYMLIVCDDKCLSFYGQSWERLQSFGKLPAQMITHTAETLACLPRLDPSQLVVIPRLLAEKPTWKVTHAQFEKEIVGDSLVKMEGSSSTTRVYVCVFGWGGAHLIKNDTR